MWQLQETEGAATHHSRFCPRKIIHRKHQLIQNCVALGVSQLRKRCQMCSPYNTRRDVDGDIETTQGKLKWMYVSLPRFRMQIHGRVGCFEHFPIQVPTGLREQGKPAPSSSSSWTLSRGTPPVETLLWATTPSRAIRRQWH